MINNFKGKTILCVCQSIYYITNGKLYLYIHFSQLFTLSNITIRRINFYQKHSIIIIIF